MTAPGDLQLAIQATADSGVQKTIVLPNLTIFIKEISFCAKKLAKYLPLVSAAFKEVREFEEQLESDIVNITAKSDPQLAIMIADLQKDFHGFIRVGKEFLHSSLWTAKYATKEDQFTEIKQQLAARQRIDKLKLYLHSLSNLLGTCKKDFAKFLTAHTKMIDQVSSAKETLSKELEKAKEESENARKSHEKVVVKSKINEGLTAACTIVAGASVTAGAMGIISPQMSAVQSSLSYVSGFLARMKEGDTVLNVMEQRRVRKDTAKKEKMNQDALNHVAKLYVSISKAVLVIESMKHNSDCASSLITEDSFACHQIDFHKLEIDMDRLQEYMSRIVTEIGENGISPISKDCDKLVSDAQSYQETDRREAPLENRMNALSVTPQVNGNLSEITPLAASDRPMDVSQLVLGRDDREPN